jgi:hypothetical protein
MKKVIKTLTAIVIALVFGACNNFFHDLIPLDDNLILSFEVDGLQPDIPVVINENSIIATVEKNSPRDALIPRITVSNQATLLPITIEYVEAAFPSANFANAAHEMISSPDVSYIMQLISANPDFSIPALNIPIDFSYPVIMLVISGKGSIRKYTVTVFEENNEPRLISMRFAKYDNPELINDALCAVKQTGTVSASALYPAEMPSLSYSLIPSFQILGESFEVDGIQITSGIDAIQFTSGGGTKTITITRDGLSKDYTLTISFSEDADSIRSITDFRFTKIDNNNIAANAVASIINTDNTGMITAQVFYSGARPSTLTPSFISPGTVRVLGIEQVSGMHSHDFTSSLEYRVVSRNGMYTRTYTVRVELISLTENAPKITAFKFSSALNAELAQDADGQISDGSIVIDAFYGGNYAPDTLIPEFKADGLVTVYGSVQVSGASAQEFTQKITYTVTNPVNSILTRDYQVQCRFVRDTSRDAKITDFRFKQQDNPGLSADVIGKIDQINGKISVYAPVGSNITTRTMIASFTAAGRVYVGEAQQVSGSSGQMFDAPVTYTVVSANGAVKCTYVVSVRELQSTIFVSNSAFGYADGTSWENAFRDLKSACDAAAEFPDDVPKELWIAAGTYKPKDVNEYFSLTANTSYIGGFAGYETAKDQRNISANVVTISGDLGSLYAKRLFNATSELNGDLSFENLRLSGVKGQQGACINALLNSASELTATDCAFEYLESSGTGGSIYVKNGSAVITNSMFYACTNGAVYVQGRGARISDLDFSTCMNGNVIRLDCTGETEISRINVEYSYGTVFYLTGNGNKTLETLTVNVVGQCMEVRNTIGSIRVNNLTMQNIFGIGINMNGANGVKRFSHLNAVNISSAAINSTATSGSFTITDNSKFDNAGVISITNGSGLVTVQNTDIKNLNAVNGLRILANNVNIDKVSIIKLNLIVDESNILRLTTPVGIYLDCSGKTSVSNITIDDLAYSYYYNGVFYEDDDRGYGIQMRGGGTLSVVNSAISRTYQGIYCLASSNLEVNTLDLKDISSYGIYSSNGYIQASNITANNTGTAVYCSVSSKKEVKIKDSTFENTGYMYFYASYSTPNSSIISASDPAYHTTEYHVDTTDSSLELSNITMNNFKGTYSGAIYSLFRNVFIDRVNINVVRGSYKEGDEQYGYFNGRGINIQHALKVQIFNSTIKDCEQTAYTSGHVYSSGTPSEYIRGYAGWEGAAIFIQCKGTTEIRQTTIDGAVSCNGGGIYYTYGPLYYYSTDYIYNGASGSSISGGRGDLTLRDVTVKNAKSKHRDSSHDVSSYYEGTGYGGGLYFYSSGRLEIRNTTFENCSADTNYGAIYTYSKLSAIDTASKFINCSGGNIPELDKLVFTLIP